MYLLFFFRCCDRSVVLRAAHTAAARGSGRPRASAIGHWYRGLAPPTVPTTGGPGTGERGLLNGGRLARDPAAGPKQTAWRCVAQFLRWRVPACSPEESRRASGGVAETTDVRSGPGRGVVSASASAGLASVRGAGRGPWAGRRGRARRWLRARGVICAEANTRPLILHLQPLQRNPLELTSSVPAHRNSNT